MTTYYVRKSGNDGNAGTTPGAAWLTIDNAANNVAAGDTVYIGAGVYRELVTMDTSGTSGNQISYIGDVTGAYTGDPGLVILTAHNAETAAAVRVRCLDINNQTFIVWQNVIFVGGTSNVVGQAAATGNWAYEGWEWLDCSFWGSESGADDVVALNVGTGAEPATAGFIFRRCSFGAANSGALLIDFTPNAVAHVNLKAEIANCFFWGGVYGIHIDTGGALAFSIGGINIVNCFAMSTTLLFLDDVENTVNPITVYNSFGYHASYFIGATGIAAGACVEDYNMGSRLTTWTSVGVTNGGNSTNGTAAPLLGGLADHMLRRAVGWSPHNPLAPIRSLDATYLCPGVEAASGAQAPADDTYNNPRPMGRNTDDVGPVEANPRGTEETGTVRSGSSSLGFIEGAGFIDKLIQVSAQSTTVEVYVYRDANYTGDNPRLVVYNIPGVADQIDTQTGAAAAWELLSVTFTPSAAGFCRVRLQSRDTSANGECYFDDFRVR